MDLSSKFSVYVFLAFSVLFIIFFYVLNNLIGLIVLIFLLFYNHSVAQGNGTQVTLPMLEIKFGKGS